MVLTPKPNVKLYLGGKQNFVGVENILDQNVFNYLASDLII